MGKTIENIASAGIVVSALTIAAVAVHRELSQPMRASSDMVTRAPSAVKNWPQLVPLGRWLGDSTAPVKIIVFSDYECPYCKKFYDRFVTVNQAMPGKASLLMVPRPLSMHRFAMPAEVAAQCAADVGHFEQLTEAIFRKQDSLGLKSWASYAADAGIADTTVFAQCAGRSKPSLGLRRAMAVDDSLGFQSTPVVVINGWRYYAPPYESLDTLVKRYAAESAKSGSR